MDTTKQYILMCEKAKEIQELPMKKNGNFYVDFMGDIQIYMEKDNDWDWQKNKEIYLPRQDQLQEMVKDSLDRKLTKFCVFSMNNLKATPMMDRPNIKFDTMEQLWLAFVMKKKYNKVWNGTDWEKEIK